MWTAVSTAAVVRPYGGTRTTKLRSRILLGLLFGTVGGFLGYALQEVLVSHDPVLDMPMAELLRFGALVGALLGLSIGAVEGMAVGSAATFLRGLCLGGVIGALGGVFGVYFGSIAYNLALFGKDPRILAENGGILDFTHRIVARALGWTFLGALPGLAAGASTLSPKRAIHGLIGGLIGGFLGGLVFDLVAEIVSQPAVAVASGGSGVIEIGGPSRAIGLTMIGALTGLSIGLVEELLKQGWVRVLAGRNEGKDYILSKALTVIGRDERADVPVFGDRSLQPQHAAIRVENGRHVLLDGGVPPQPIVNGQPVQGGRQLLRDGDMIQIGQVRLLFREKATAARVRRPATDVAPAPVAGASAVPAHLCPFCGAQKDPQGNCLCSVPGAGAAAALPSAGAPPVGGAPIGVASRPGGYGAQAGVKGSRLVALEGPYAGQVFPLAASVVEIGREPTRAVSLAADTTVSRRHARIVDEGGRHVVYDEGSSNGTFVNGVRLTQQPLSIGDVLQLGSSSFRYE